MPKSKHNRKRKVSKEKQPSKRSQLAKEQRERKSMAIWLSAAATVFLVVLFFYIRHSLANGKEVHLPIGSGGVIILLATWSVFDWWRNRRKKLKDRA